MPKASFGKTVLKQSICTEFWKTTVKIVPEQRQELDEATKAAIERERLRGRMIKMKKLMLQKQLLAAADAGRMGPAAMHFR